MRNFIGQFKQNFIPAGLMLFIGVITLCVMATQFSMTTAITYPIELWIDACSILDFFFPLIAVLPFTWRMFFDKKDGFLEYAAIRISKKKYIFQKIAAGMLAAFVMIYLMYFISLVYTVLIVEADTVVPDAILHRYLFGKMQAEQPILFCALWCIWKAVVGALICGFGYAIALLVDNFFVVSLTPFIYCMVENFVTGTLGLELYSFTTTYILNRLSPTSMRLQHYFVGVVTFAVIGGAIVAVLFYRKKRVEISEEHN